MKKILIFLSGRGSNCKALIEYQKSNPNCGFEIVGVITDKPGAAGLYYVKAAGLPVHEYFRADYDSRAAFVEALLLAGESTNADFFVLAGFMVVIPKPFINKYFGRIFNIHPSLLPDYPGLNTHERILNDRKKVHGCTVHLVDEAIDRGAIIAHCKVAIEPNDTADLLAARVLLEEHRLYGWCIEQVANGNIQIQSSQTVDLQNVATITYASRTKEQAAERGFILPV